MSDVQLANIAARNHSNCVHVSLFRIYRRKPGGQKIRLYVWRLKHFFVFFYIFCFSFMNVFLLLMWLSSPSWTSSPLPMPLLSANWTRHKHTKTNKRAFDELVFWPYIVTITTERKGATSWGVYGQHRALCLCIGSAARLSGSTYIVVRFYVEVLFIIL